MTEMFTTLKEYKWAWVILGRWEGFRAIIAYREIKKGKHKGLFRVRLTNGRNAWAREVRA